MAGFVLNPCDDGVVRSAPERVACERRAARLALAVAIVGSAMTFVDGTVVNVALPVLQVKLGATAAQVQWVVEAYALFLAALILVGGSAGDRYGRRRVFEVGVVVFGAASLWCGLARGVEQLVVARAVQGIGAALLVPGSLALIGATFPRAERGRAIGTWSAVTSIAAGAGPLVGGWLVERFSWRWIFFLNLPLAVAVLAICRMGVPESRDESTSGSLDWPGASLATVGLGGVVFGLIEAGTRGFGAASVIGSLLGGSALLVAFVVVEARVRRPMVPLGLFRSRTFTGANLLTLFLYAALGGTLFFLPFNLIRVQGYSPMEAGAALVPFVAVMVVLSRVAGSVVDRYGARTPLVAGPLVAAAGFALMALPGVGGRYWTTFFPAVLVMSVGMGFAVVPLTTTVMTSVDERSAGTASGINNAASRIASLLAVAALGVVVLMTFQRHMSAALAALPLDAATREALAAQSSRLAAVEIPPGLDDALKEAVRGALDAAFVAGFRAAVLVCAGLGVASAACAWATIDRDR